jgi:Na+/proline symporter
MKNLGRYISLIFAFVFVVFVVVQYNDPDWYLWIPIYLFPAILCFLTFRNKGNFRLNIGSMIASFIGAVYLWPQEFKGILFEMNDRVPEIELARESLGLVVCGIALAIASFTVGRPTNQKTDENIKEKVEKLVS